jgi:glutaredoxin 3
MEEITVYTTPTCPWCSKAKSYLSEKGVAYKEVNVATDANAARQMVEITGQRSVPVIAKGDQYVVGFNQGEIDRILH